VEVTTLFWITAAYISTVVLLLVSRFVNTISFTLFAGLFSAWVFILGGAHQLINGKITFSVVMGGVCVIGGIYINHCYLKLYKLNQQWKVVEESRKLLKVAYKERLKRMFWSVRN